MRTQSSVAKNREHAEEHAEVKRLASCPFCTSRLTFSHEIDPMTISVVETAHCIGCGVALAPKLFTIQ